MHDFYYLWVTHMTPATGSIAAGYLYNNIKIGEAFYKGEVSAEKLGLKVLDDYTMMIEWSRPKPEAKGLFNLSQPFHLPINQKAYEEIGEQQYAKDADQMVTKQEKDVMKRQDLLIQAERILIDDMAIGPMYFTCTTYAVSDKLKGLVRTPFQFFNVRSASIAAE